MTISEETAFKDTAMTVFREKSVLRNSKKEKPIHSDLDKYLKNTFEGLKENYL